MDKIEFIEKAPLYYAAGIAFALLHAGDDVFTRDAIDNRLDPEIANFKRDPLWNRAVSILRSHNVLSIIADDFGPVLYAPRPELDAWIGEAAPKLYPLFSKVRTAGTSWLKEAIQNVNATYARLNLKEADFAAVEESEWEPIPVDRNDPSLQTVRKAVDDAIQQIEADNGYAVNAPGERDYVVSNLKVFRVALREQAAIYALQVKAFVLDPLARVVTRFGTAATGLAASAARQAVFDWIKNHAAKLLSLLG